MIKYVIEFTRNAAIIDEGNINFYLAENISNINPLTMMKRDFNKKHSITTLIMIAVGISVMVICIIILIKWMKRRKSEELVKLVNEKEI